MSSTSRVPSDPRTPSHAIDVFDRERPRLLGLAYRLLGSMTDAEDVVQETWLHFDRVDLGTIESPAAWLTTVVGRRGLDRLRIRQRDRAEYVGPWLPEPISGPAEPSPSDVGADPADHAVLADSLTTAFLVLLEALTPQERLAVLLADVFALPFSGVAVALDKSEDASRQLASRARRKLREADPSLVDGRPTSASDQHAVAARFVAALANGDMVEAAELLAPDVQLLSDGGALVRAARRPVVGRARVARVLGSVMRNVERLGTPSAGVLNHRPAVVIHRDGRATLAAVFDVVDGKVHRLYVVANPDKLAFVDEPAQLC